MPNIGTILQCKLRTHGTIGDLKEAVIKQAQILKARSVVGLKKIGHVNKTLLHNLREGDSDEMVYHP